VPLLGASALWLGASAPELQVKQTQLVKKLESDFDKADLQHRGKIDFDEFHRMVRECLVRWSTAQAATAARAVVCRRRNSRKRTPSVGHTVCTWSVVRVRACSHSRFGSARSCVRACVRLACAWVYPQVVDHLEDEEVAMALQVPMNAVQTAVKTADPSSVQLAALVTETQVEERRP
jgi:hypothetical protein